MHTRSHCSRCTTISGIIRLTPQNTKDGRGESGGPEIGPSVRAALEKAFLDWYGLNSGAILYDGDCGDVLELYHSLSIAFANAVRSSLEAPNDC